MIELLLAAIPVALAVFWRTGHDAGRSHQRRLSVLNPGEAIIIDMGKASMMMTPSDFERIADREYDRDGWFLRREAMFRADPMSTFKVTGLA